MEELIARQAELYETLKQIQINFKKDSDSRKTPDYLQERLSRLNNLWSEFNHNNSALAEYKTVASTEPYFLKDIFQSASNIYRTTLDMITLFSPELKQLHSDAKAGSSNNQSDKNKSDKGTNPSGQIDEFIKEQRTNFRALRRLIRGIDIEQLSEKWELEDELRNLQTRWNAIDRLHLKIDNILQGGDLDYEDEFTTYESSYKRIKRVINQKIVSSAHIHQVTPQIEIPVYTGKYTSWPTFFDLFTETIHNNNALSKAQKMQHLKGKIKGEAERLIQHLNISAENYDTAWEILTHRYNNPQLLFTKQVETFLNQPNIQKQTSFEIKKLYDTSMETLNAIHNLGVDTTTWDPLLVHILSKKLDQETYCDYKEARKNPRDLPALDEFLQFLENKFTALEPIHKRESSASFQSRPTYNQAKQTFIKQQPNYYQGKYQRAPYQAIVTTQNNKCPLCTQYHDVFRCKKFLGMTSDLKLKAVSRFRLCQNCLYNHYNNKCFSAKRCKECNGEHNTLLHDACVRAPVSNSGLGGPPPLQSMPLPTYNSAKSLADNKPHNVNYVASNDEEILLTTLLLNIKSAEGNFVTLRALLDQGSQISLISENAAQMLGLKRNQYSASISGIGNGCKQSKGIVNLECQSIYKDYHFSTQALVITKIVNNLPSTSFNKQAWPHIQNINLADPQYNISRPIDLLLDANVYSNIILSGFIKSTQEAPIAQQTKLGWILSGNVKKAFNCHVVINNLSDIAKYWEMEDVTRSDTSSLTREEQYCEELYVKTTRRLESGKYEVALPMKPSFEQELGLSKSRAVAQFRQLEQRLCKNEDIAKPYRDFMAEYEQLGHMRKVDTVVEPSCYFPHHAVWKPDSDSTKCRVVFNASLKTTSNQSLNDLMERGPNLQQDLQTLILSWRQYKYVLNADIEKMFRMIFIRRSDQQLQKIVWRAYQEQELEEYCLTTVSFGTKAAPFLAMRTLRQLAIDDGEKYPLTPDILKYKFYMDDLFYGSNSILEAKSVQKQLIAILKGAGFNLRKWSSNHLQLLEGLSTDQINAAAIDFQDAQTTKALGLRWNSTTDTFTFNDKHHHCDSENIRTKRQLLSHISKVFDPIGWLSPLTIRSKLLFQKAWAAGVSWDDELPTDIQNEWQKLRPDLQNIENIIIPRHFGNTDQLFELHGFADATDKTFACCVYIVTINDKGERTSRLVAAKTKLAPLNTKISLPRLELCSALLLTTLMKKVLDCFSQTNIKLFAWSDSMVALGWIKGDIARWKQFVANRVQQIINVLPPSAWRHVRSEENAADCATRGLSSNQFIQHSLWWEGLKWLTTFNLTDSPDVKYQQPTLEAKKASVCTALYQKETTIISELLDRYNSITRAAKTMAWISRFIARARGQQNAESTSTLSSSEVNNALYTIIKHIQSIDFKDDIKNLKLKNKVQINSRLSNLNPFMDKDSILKVGGRLSNSNVSGKNPIILSNQNRLTELIINQAHAATLHGGPRLTLSYIRDKYWLLSGMRTVKKQLRRCVTCRRFSHQKLNQIMADLPATRVTPSRPFTHCGVDFTGHVELKANKGRGIRTTKGYISVFVCLATKAVHLELVSDLSAASFLAAFRRLCARRGTPKDMYSDNGTNFIGAAKHLKKEYQEIVQCINTDFINRISDLGVNWHFNAPAWPSAGGLWESAVRSMKYHLRRVIGTQKLTYEEFTTLLTQIEACLNSRPLCSVTENVEDLDVLSPGHFLVGGPLLSSPESESCNITLPMRWQLVQTMTRGFWKKLSHEYLQTLQTRSKWQTVKADIKINDVVLIKDENLPATRWGLARVVDVHPGKDGHVRVVTLKTKCGTIKRPITKLCLLPVHDQEETKEQPQANSSEKQDTNKSLTSDATSSSSKRTRNPNNKFSAFTLFLSLFCLFTPSLQQRISSSSIINVTELQNDNQALYFDKITNLQHIRDEWKLIVYYNMSTYWQGLADMEHFITHLTEVAGSDPQYKSILYQLQHEIREIRHYNTLLQHKSLSRQRRGLVNGVGYLANSLFGILDERFAEKYEKDIIKITQNENHLKNLICNQTIVLEAEYNVLKRNENNMNKQFTFIKQRLNNISMEMDQVTFDNKNGLYITSSALTASIILSNFRRIQQSLLDTVTDISHGRIDTHLITPEQLNEQINLISRYLQGDLNLPVSVNAIRDIYKLLSVFARVVNNFLIIEIKIPLVNSDIYEVNRIISIPQKRSNNLSFKIMSKLPYIAYNMKKDVVIYYQKMTSDHAFQLQRKVYYYALSINQYTTSL